jgi:hypothetical protein
MTSLAFDIPAASSRPHQDRRRRAAACPGCLETPVLDVLKLDTLSSTQSDRRSAAGRGLTRSSAPLAMSVFGSQTGVDANAAGRTATTARMGGSTPRSWSCLHLTGQPPSGVRPGPRNAACEVPAAAVTARRSASVVAGSSPGRRRVVAGDGRGAAALAVAPRARINHRDIRPGHRPTFDAQLTGNRERRSADGRTWPQRLRRGPRAPGWTPARCRGPRVAGVGARSSRHHRPRASRAGLARSPVGGPTVTG